MNETEQLYNELIMEHSMSSEHKRNLDKCDIKEKGHNPSCGDEIVLEIKIEDDEIVDMAFTGHGCAISQSSTSIMIETLLGKKVKDAKELASLFTNMIRREKLSEEQLESLEDAAIFQNVSNMPARVKCALLPWHTLQNILENK